jgi:predicted DNA-binding protein
MDEGKMVQAGFRLPEKMMERIDRELELSKTESPGLRLTRADVVRELIEQALNERQWFREYPRKPWPGPAEASKALGRKRNVG